jgi:hypothetical protein
MFGVKMSFKTRAFVIHSHARSRYKSSGWVELVTNLTLHSVATQREKKPVNNSSRTSLLPNHSHAFAKSFPSRPVFQCKLTACARLDLFRLSNKSLLFHAFESCTELKSKNTLQHRHSGPPPLCPGRRTHQPLSSSITTEDVDRSPATWRHPGLRRRTSTTLPIFDK